MTFMVIKAQWKKLDILLCKGKG